MLCFKYIATWLDYIYVCIFFRLFSIIVYYKILN